MKAAKSGYSLRTLQSAPSRHNHTGGCESGNVADPTSRYEWTMLFVAILFSGATWLIAAAVRAPKVAPPAHAELRKGAPATAT
jgi:hypothetical protein